MLTFGVPLPLNPDNVFSISKKTWLLGQVSVPEGLLAGYGKAILDEDATRIKKVLDELFPETILLRSEAPLQYKFFINGAVTTQGSPEYKLGMSHMPSVRVITLKHLCRYFEEHPGLWGDNELYEFSELIKDSRPELWIKMKQEYTFASKIL